LMWPWLRANAWTLTGTGVYLLAVWLL
jgi:hypothetical protein